MSKSSSKPSKKLILSLLFILALSFMASSAYIFYSKYNINNPVPDDMLSGDMESFDAVYTYKSYKFYFIPKPDINNRVYYGYPNASITIIAFLDITSESSRHFMNEIFPKLEDEFIKNGKARFYGKNHVTMQDFMQKNNKLLYAEYLTCIESLESLKKIKKQAYYSFYFDMFKLNGIEGIEEISELMGKHNITKQMLDKCLKENSFNDLTADLLEIENFGFSGISPRFYIGIDGTDNTILEGVPRYSKFNRTIRQYGFSIGN